MRSTFLLAALLVVLQALPASAHTELDTTVPAADSEVLDPPSEVVLDFTAALLPDSEPAVRVIDPNGDDLVAAPPTLEGATVTVPLNLAVTPGPHRVDWAITAADGDDQTGSFTFVFAPPADVATPPGAVVPTESAPTEAVPTESADSATGPADPTPSPAEATDPGPAPEASEPTATPSAVPGDPEAASTTTRALVVVAAFFAVLGVGAVMLARARRDGSEE
ncbi:copper resistance CopC family protein [Euzebya rosea]|uniref:copper resistance CopC family protein n=1 Tax=Euzebya rosea TaxID=2052804 RepID=UPI000D3E68C9|nr:copper resistance CopC family protein [Euzebya rosea]